MCDGEYGCMFTVTCVPYMLHIQGISFMEIIYIFSFIYFCNAVCVRVKTGHYLLAEIKYEYHIHEWYILHIFNNCEKNFFRPVIKTLRSKTLLTGSYFRTLRTIWLLPMKALTDLNKSFTISTAYTQNISIFN